METGSTTSVSNLPRGVYLSTLDEPQTATPNASVRVHGQPVGKTEPTGDLSQDLPATQAAPLPVEAEAIDPSGRAVDVVHHPAVGTPADPVGDRHPGQDLLDPPVLVEPVEGALTRWPGDPPGRPRPEPPLGIASAVVETVAGLFEMQGDDHTEAPGLEIESPESVPRGDHQPSL